MAMASRQGEVHPRNALNDLSCREWLRATKSFWLSAAPPVDAQRVSQALDEFAEWLLDQRGYEDAERILGQVLSSFVYSITPPRDRLKSRHPATFSEPDIERLVRLFTKQGETVLDPFAGVGSSLVAALRAGRRAIGVELSSEWASLARERLERETPLLGTANTPEVLEGDSGEILRTLPDDSVDFAVTSPPYWFILNKRPSMKGQAERLSRGLATTYSESDEDLGNIEDYGEFVDRLSGIFGECLRVVRPGRYMAVIVSDFRHGERFFLFHADLSAALEQRGWVLSGVTVLAQDNKTLYPYGIPYAFVSNVHHQYILVFRKRRVPAPRTRPAATAGKPKREPRKRTQTVETR